MTCRVQERQLLPFYFWKFTFVLFENIFLVRSVTQKAPSECFDGRNVEQDKTKCCVQE